MWALDINVDENNKIKVLERLETVGIKWAHGDKPTKYVPDDCILTIEEGGELYHGGGSTVKINGDDFLKKPINYVFMFTKRRVL